VFKEALAHILSQLEGARSHGLLQDYALIGGFAVSTWGIPRATQDIDFAVAIGAVDPQRLAEFMDGRYEPGEADDPLRGVVHATIDVGPEAVSVQLVLFPPVLTTLTFRHIETVSILEQEVPVVSWQALVLLKIYAGGPQDKLDARQILALRNPHPDDLRTIAEMADSLGILSDWITFIGH
jgi:hypothetical protein